MPRALPVALLALLFVAEPAAAAGKLPDSGFIVFKDLRSHAVTEVRDRTTGGVVASAASFGETGDRGTACRDSRDKLVAPSWRTFEAYLVDAASIPAPLRPSDALAELIAAHAAWKSRFATECTATPAGLDHVESSPALTMFPIVHDGDDTLGLGDMKGLLALY